MGPPAQAGVRLLRFITAIPLDVRRGSGCYVGIQTLRRGLAALGHPSQLVTPRLHLPVYTAARILFNEQLRFEDFGSDLTVGVDLDGYAIAGRRGSAHVAAIKGVLGDAVRFESGFNRASLMLQARLERLHARRAGRVITISRYCAQRLDDLYGVPDAMVVPELIDLEYWRGLFAAHPAPASTAGRFTVLCVCHFYPRKRVDVLLRAAAILRVHMPELEVRIVGSGAEAGRLRALAAELHLHGTVTWVGNASDEALAREYNGADVFCLPSVQEGFGIVFLEAMAAGKPIVGASAAAVPEVVRHGLLVEPGDPEALAEAIGRLYTDSDLRRRLGEEGNAHVENFEMRRVAELFYRTVRD